ncbi:MAG: hypothetical protein HY805_01625 [Nitrospirae bacterium]|nr:hypothetical protein [Nitrospirota bacterium]
MAEKILTITEVTAMHSDNVCIAGVNFNLACIRPVLSRGQIKKSHLFKSEKLIIYPGAEVLFNLLSADPHPPHIEDWIFDGSIAYKGKVTENAWRDLLDKTSSNSFAELFPNMQERYVPPDSTGPSIGGLLPKEIVIDYDSYYNRLRMVIVDKTGIRKERVPITDFAFRNLFFKHMLNKLGGREAVIELNNKISEREICLRLGLSRPYLNAPVPYSGWCCLQVNGIHTLPDLYDGDYSRWITLE